MKRDKGFKWVSLVFLGLLIGAGGVAPGSAQSVTWTHVFITDTGTTNQYDVIDTSTPDGEYLVIHRLSGNNTGVAHQWDGSAWNVNGYFAEGSFDRIEHSVVSNGPEHYVFLANTSASPDGVIEIWQSLDDGHTWSLFESFGGAGVSQARPCLKSSLSFSCITIAPSGSEVFVRDPTWVGTNNCGSSNSGEAFRVILNDTGTQYLAALGFLPGSLDKVGITRTLFNGTSCVGKQTYILQGATASGDQLFDGNARFVEDEVVLYRLRVGVGDYRLVQTQFDIDQPSSSPSHTELADDVSSNNNRAIHATEGAGFVGYQNEASGISVTSLGDIGAPTGAIATGISLGPDEVVVFYLDGTDAYAAFSSSLGLIEPEPTTTPPTITGGTLFGDNGALFGGNKSALADAIQVSEGGLEAMMAVLWILIFAGIGWGATKGHALGAASGAGLGVMFTFAFGLIPLWFILLLLAIGAAAVVAFRQRGAAG